ncbi:MAG: hypothetical protein RL685_6035 [Pseudomonadota bacterium]|jgi:hypothetical protein
MRLALTFGLLVTTIALPSLAEAAPYRYRRHQSYREREYYPERAPYYDHQGLLLRFTAGAGGAAADDDLNDVTLSGGSGSFSVDLGGSIAPSLALHGRLALNSMFEPSVSESGAYTGDLDDTSLTFVLVGMGATYYLPTNLYLTGVVGLSRASFQLYGDEYDALNGVGVMGDVGYEWPIGGDWGLGVAGRAEFHSVRGDGEQLSTAGLSVLLTLTHF